MINIIILYHRIGDTKNVGKTTFFFAIFLHIILPFTIYEGSSYYAVVYNKYYKINLTDSGVKIDRKESEIDVENSANILAATSSDESIVKIEEIKGNVITLTGGSSTGTATITVSYGSYSKTCDISVVVKPIEDSEADSTTTFSTNYGRIDVIWLDGTSNTVTTIPNAPILTSNGESMTPIIWDSDNNIVETTASNSNWYSYTPGTGTTTDPDDGNTSYMNSHMMKNSEWGAVAYLTQSKYGRNGTEITKNDNGSFYRGGGSGTAYITNTNQSTTGNVYGIYDMSGGGFERMAAFNGIDSYGRLASSGWTEATGLTADSSSTKYATKYNATGSYYGNELVYNYGKVGDATKEVNTGGIYDEEWTSHCLNWFSDSGHMIHSEYPFFNRGGKSSTGDEAGIFSSVHTAGSGWHERFSYSYLSVVL